MPRRTGLGRGLDALIPSNESTPASGAVYIPIEQIQRNPRQPRMQFDPTSLSELSASIRQYGVLQPLLVTYDDQSGAYTLVAGERRLMAARQAGLETVPAIIRQASDQQRLELALIENIQRADLNPLESAEAYRQLVDEFGLSHDEISARVGKSRVTITNTLRLLKLAPAARQALIDEKITEGHARALLTLSAVEAQENAVAVILKLELNVRQTEDLVRRLSGQRSPHPTKPAPPAELTDLEERLRNHLGTRVKLNRRNKGGTLVIHYYSEEELNSLIAQILGD